MSQLNNSLLKSGFEAGKDTHICVLRECSVSPPNLARLLRLLRRLRAQAMVSRGYLSGALWQDIYDPYQVITLDSWQSAEHWDNFHNAAENRDIEGEIKTLLAGPAIVRLVREPPNETLGPF